MRNDGRKVNRGFTLVEIILVLGLVVTLGAMAAPQFMDVFDDSKDKAEIAQMDQILAAFQMQQGMVFESHTGDYDMSNPNNVIEDGDEENPKEVAAGSLEKFLKDSLASPGSAVYMEGVKSLRDGKVPTYEDPIYQVESSDDFIWLSYKGHDSSVKIRITGSQAPVNYEYSDGKLSDGTWLVIGDDDRLRGDYVEDYLKKTNKKTKEKLEDQLEDNKAYKFRTNFKIQTKMSEKIKITPNEENLVFGDWIDWAVGDQSGIPHIGLKKKTKEVKVSYIFNAHNGKVEKGILEFSENGDPKYIQVPVGQNDLKIKFIVEKAGEKTLQREYWVDVDKLHFSFINNKVEEGYIQCKNNNWNQYFHYDYIEGSDRYLDEDINGSLGTKVTIKYPASTFYTGVVFNVKQQEKTKAEKNDKDNNSNQEKKYLSYDFLSFEYDDAIHKTVMKYYEGNGRNYSQIGESVILEDFQYNHEYTIELNVTQEKAIYVTLFDHSHILLDKEEMAMGNNNLHSAIGYYMNQKLEVIKNNAIASENEELPLVQTYSSDNGMLNEPRFVLLTIPEFYPYNSNTSQPSNPGGDDSQGNEQNPKPEEPNVSFAKPKIGLYTGEPNMPYEVNAKTAGNQVEYTWVEGIENDSIEFVDWSFASNGLDLGKSGWLWAREKKDGDTAPKEKWERKPWVGDELHNASLVEKTSLPDVSLSYRIPELLEGEYEIWHMIGNEVNWEKGSNFTEPLESCVVDWVVRFRGEQVSERISYNHTYTQIKDVIPPKVAVRIKANYNNGGHYQGSTIYIKLLGEHESLDLSYNLQKVKEKDNREGIVEIDTFEKSIELGSNWTSFSFEVIDKADNITSDTIIFCQSMSEKPYSGIK